MPPPSQTPVAHPTSFFATEMSKATKALPHGVTIAFSAGLLMAGRGSASRGATWFFLTEASGQLRGGVSCHCHANSTAMMGGGGNATRLPGNRSTLFVLILVAAAHILRGRQLNRTLRTTGRRLMVGAAIVCSGCLGRLDLTRTFPDQKTNGKVHRGPGQPDECDTTRECKTYYGERATDCYNSWSNQSVCHCQGVACSDINPGTDQTAGDADPDVVTSCVPDCSGMECGDDGCGGSCGICGAGHTCDSSWKCVEAGSGEGVQHNYSPDHASIFPNPERGWHVRRDIDGRGGDDDRNFSDVRADGHTLVHSYLRLDDFADRDALSQSYLDDLQEALDAIRHEGLKLVLRPSYVWDSEPSVPESRILMHIEQINEVLSANADVVMHLEAGYLGKWGEWHSGLHTDLSNQSKAATRYRVIKKILDTTPETIPIAIRYPMALTEILDYERLLGSPPSGSSSLTQTDRDRLGHHNDCFLYNEHDRGTYARNDLWFGNRTLEEQKQYAFDLITSYGGNKIVGGETCSGMGRFDDTQTDIAAANWTEINESYWGDFIDAWKNQYLPAQGDDPDETTYERLSRKLGYRLRLIDATFPTTASAGGSFTFSARLSNDGYASVVKTRSVYLVLDSGFARYDIMLSNVDVRTWLSGSVTLDQKTVTLPSEMPSGTYALALWLPDAAADLQSRPEYSIRFANEGTWDADNGYNTLSRAVVITPPRSVGRE